MLSKSIFSYFKTKKKVPMAIKLEGGGEGLSGLATSGSTFFCAASLKEAEKKIAENGF